MAETDKGAAVAQAQKNLSDAQTEAAKQQQKQVEESQKRSQEARAAELARQPVIMSGDTLGGPFSIRGEGFGSGGTLTVGGQPVPTTRWDDKNIRGTMPPGLQGEVVVTTPSGERRGTFPAPKQVVKRTTTTVEEQVTVTAAAAAASASLPPAASASANAPDVRK